MDDQNTRDFQNAVYALANAIGGMVEAMGMQALNQYRIDRGETIAYNDKAFQKVVDDRGLHHNSLMTQIYNR
jgi:hypothetical protein